MVGFWGNIERCYKCLEKETPCVRCLRFEYNKRHMKIIDILESQQKSALEELTKQAQDLKMGY